MFIFVLNVGNNYVFPDHYTPYVKSVELWVAELTLGQWDIGQWVKWSNLDI